MAQIAVNAAPPATVPAAGTGDGTQVSGAAAGLFSVLLQCLQTGAESNGGEEAAGGLAEGGESARQDDEKKNSVDAAAICLCAYQIPLSTVPETANGDAAGVPAAVQPDFRGNDSAPLTGQSMAGNEVPAQAHQGPPGMYLGEENPPVSADFTQITQTGTAKDGARAEKADAGDFGGEETLKSVDIGADARDIANILSEEAFGAGIDGADGRNDANGKSPDENGGGSFRGGKTEEEKPNTDASKPRQESRAESAGFDIAAGLAGKRGIGTADFAQPEETAAAEKSPASQLADAIKETISRKRDEFTISLKPEGLGSVTVSLVMKKEKIGLNIKSAAETTKELIAARLGELKTELEASGYEVDSLNIAAEPGADSGMRFETGAYSGGNGNSGGFTGGEPERAEGGFRRTQEKSDAGAMKREIFRTGKINYRI
jgi:hypothetical protein